ncbi:MAG: ATP-binding cassette domain-containing protein, partial [Comamonas sp.]
MLLNVSQLHALRGAGDQAFHVRLPSLQLARGEVAAIVGESGCGKSTLLESLGLLLTPQQLNQFTLGAQGQDLARDVLAHNEPLLARVRAQQLGFVLQNGGLLPYLSVRENISLPRRLMGQSSTAPFVEEAIDALRLRHLLGSKPSALSIGERQRVACVRALAHAPQVLLADEPTAALDPS